MLKGIPPILSPELLKILMEMGHGDDLVIGDGNYPAASSARHLVRLDGHGVCELLDAILTFFPLDTFVEAPVTLMKPVDGTADVPIWKSYREIIEKHAPVQRSGSSSASTTTSAPTRPTPSSPPVKWRSTPP